MSEIWPLDVRKQLSSSEANLIRPFRCLLLMPFEKRFNNVAEIIRGTVEETLKNFNMDLPEIKRLDWLTSSGIIQNEIWAEVISADLIFCDITGYNPNVMFESGVSAAWKEINQVVFIKDHYFRQESAFDIAPIRYTEYELTSDGIHEFAGKIVRLTQNALISFPDRQSVRTSITLPFEKDFRDGQDDLRFLTPPFSHRRVVEGSLEFGSIYSFVHSWATIGCDRFYTFSLECSARFFNPLKDRSWIGIGLRSQHYYANYAHIIYLRRDGSIAITEPNEEPPSFYKDKELRNPTEINPSDFHLFRVLFTESDLTVHVDGFEQTFNLSGMNKVFGPGLIRFQSSTCWMGIQYVKVSTPS